MERVMYNTVLGAKALQQDGKAFYNSDYHIQGRKTYVADGNEWPCCSGTLPQIAADSVQLTQALVNLVINAIQAIERNGRVEVSADMDERGEILTIAVGDTGPGVPSDKQSAIFDPFFTTKAEGSGLGLWIVQQIITTHGGVIEVSNAPRGGAVFAAHLPLRRKENGNG